MAYYIALLALVFAMFPYVQLYPLETYNQPYAVMSSALFLAIVPMSLARIPRNDRLALLYLAIIGFILFLIEVPRGLDDREVLYLGAYITPLLVVPPIYYVMSHRPDTARRFLSGAIVLWIIVGAIQRFIDLTFLNFLVTQSEDLSVNIAASGRGVLGFAPEPTHHGLHLISMAAGLMLMKGNRIFVGLALVGAVLLAGSSFAFLALACGTLVWAISSPLKRSWFFLLAIAGILLSSFLPLLLSGDSRLVLLIDTFLYSGFDVFIADASANMRFSGILLPIQEAFSSGLTPIGLSWQNWLEMRSRLLVENSWAFSLSETGPASGWGLVLVQTGFLGLPFLAFMVKRFLVDFSDYQVGVLVGGAFFSFMGQLYLATPSFAIVYAAAIWAMAQRRRSLLRMQNQKRRTGAHHAGTRPHQPPVAAAGPPASPGGPAVTPGLPQR